MASIEQSLLFCLIFKAAVAFCFCVSPCLADLPRFRHKLKDENLVSFLAVGDWGRRGKEGQQEVADQMGIVGEEMVIEFVISTGDNFYRSGITGPDDDAFIESYVKIYKAPSLQKIWYIVLGNRDYRGDVEAQLTRSVHHKAEKVKSVSNVEERWFCHRSYIVDTEFAEFFFVDTTPLVNKYFDEPGPHKYDWRGVDPREEYISNLLGDLKSALKGTPSNKWKIVIGHHTIKSAGERGGTQELIDDLLPILKENKVDFYINGHDHCLQYILDTDSGIHFITSGGGSKTVTKKNEWKPAHELKLHHGGQGFVAMKITPAKAEFKFYNGEGKVLREFSVPKNHRVSA